MNVQRIISKIYSFSLTSLCPKSASSTANRENITAWHLASLNSILFLVHYTRTSTIYMDKHAHTQTHVQKFPLRIQPVAGVSASPQALNVVTKNPPLFFSSSSVPTHKSTILHRICMDLYTKENSPLFLKNACAMVLERCCTIHRHVLSWKQTYKHPASAAMDHHQLGISRKNFSSVVREPFSRQYHIFS